MSKTRSERLARASITGASKLEVKGYWPESNVPVDDLPTLHPTIPIATGYRWSQIWLGCLVRGEISETVILKIFQGSMFPRDIEMTHPIDPETLAHNEAEAFSAMIALQGTVVPLSYGFFNILVDDVEDVIVHVMEFVNASTLEELQYPRSSSQSCHPSVKPDSLVAALQLIHGCDICHQDLNQSNVLITPTSRVVFVDFAMSKVSQDTASKDEDMHNLLLIMLSHGHESSQLETGFSSEILATVRTSPRPRYEVDIDALWRRPPPNLKWTSVM
ncbi:hypothetical protein DL96DRAFT_1631549 [Flagelloscypha sp. PMI_526]|nr:hypothetical protein DL96DRAFT_1631549 [Flagelloscypha sp. PMI_526]